MSKAHNHLLVAIGGIPDDVALTIQHVLKTETDAWWSFFPNMWIVCTPGDVHTWQQRLGPLLSAHPQAHLLILELKHHASKNGLLPQAAWDWLASHHL